nr:hypothetical protein [Rickettsiaceae bacterium]
MVDLTNTPVIIVHDLNSARATLKNIDYPVAISNAKGATRYLGILQINYIFKKLCAEFPIIKSVIIDCGDDNAAKSSLDFLLW